MNAPYHHSAPYIKPTTKYVYPSHRRSAGLDNPFEWKARDKRLVEVVAIAGEAIITAEDNIIVVGVEDLTTSKSTSKATIEAAVIDDVADIALEVRESRADGARVLPRSGQLSAQVKQRKPNSLLGCEEARSGKEEMRMEYERRCRERLRYH